MLDTTVLRQISRSTSGQSLAEAMAELPKEELKLLLGDIASLPEKEREWFEHSWEVFGRPKQQPPDHCADPACGCEGAWNVWLMLCGRAFGKTRTLSEYLHDVAWKFPKCRIGIVAPTANSMRSVLVEGESGIISTEKPWNKAHYEPSKLRITFENGSVCSLFSADEPERLRGPQFHFVLCDELAAWEALGEGKAEKVWQQIKLTLRLPRRPNWTLPFRPRVVIATTPVPIPIIRKLAGADPFQKSTRTHVTRGGTRENKANLAEEYFTELVADLAGTRLGRQELEGEILQDVPGALWKVELIDQERIEVEQMPPLKRIVVAVDPSVGGDNATGIVVIGTGPPPLGRPHEVVESNNGVRRTLVKQQRTHGYVLADLSKHGSPDAWARAVVRAYHEYEADAIVAESNQGGDLIKSVIRQVDPNVVIRMVHASRGKRTRAEPVVAIYEQKRIHHIGKHPELETEMLTWDPDMTDHSPDRMDALVWGVSHLMGKGKIHAAAAPVTIPKGAMSVYHSELDAA